MTKSSPPFVAGAGIAPREVCARWLKDHPCGAHATWHIIWDTAMQNGPVCDVHMSEARQRWVFLDAHAYSQVCGLPGSMWHPSDRVCFMPDGPKGVAGQ